MRLVKVAKLVRHSLVGSCMVLGAANVYAYAASNRQPQRHARVSIPVIRPRNICLGEFEATAYCKCRICCGKWAKYHRTAGGVDIKNWKPVIAADERVLPLGSHVEVEGVGHRLVSDTGSKASSKHILGRRIDVLFPTHSSAKQFGRRKVKVWRQVNGN